MTTLARRLIAILLVASSLGGCTGYTRIAVGPARPAQPISVDAITVGQTLHVQLRNAPSRTITVKAIETDAVVGERGERLARAQIVAVTQSAVGVSPLRRFWLYGLIIVFQAIVYAVYEN